MSKDFKFIGIIVGIQFIVSLFVGGMGVSPVLADTTYVSGVIDTNTVGVTNKKIVEYRYDYNFSFAHSETLR